MTRKQLEDLGLTKEQADSIIKINGDDIENAKSASAAEIKNLQTEVDGLKTQVGDRDKQLETLKASAGDNADLKKQIEQLQEDNKRVVKEKEAEIKQMQIDNAVSAALKDAGAKNITAAIALLKDMDKAELDSDGTVKGLAEQIEQLQESDSYLFDVKEEPQKSKPAGATPAGGGSTHVPGTITKEQFAKMGYKEREELYNTNKELYDSLVK